MYPSVVVMLAWAAVLDFLDGSDASEGKEEAEAIREICVGARDRLAAGKLLGLQGMAIGGEDELAATFGCRGALTERFQRPGDGELITLAALASG